MLHLLKGSRLRTKKINFNFGGFAFDPLTFDVGNLVALYNGDVGLSGVQWNDQAGGAHNIIFTGNPSVILNAQNGHNSVRFNGTTQYGTVATPVTSHPFTTYLVFRNNLHLGNRYIMDDGVVATVRNRVSMVNPSNNMQFVNDGVNLPFSPTFTVGAFNIMTGVVQTGANNFKLRINNNVATTTTIVAPALRSGITLACALGGLALSQSEFLYIVLRSGADSTAYQDQFINYFKSRFAI